MLNTFTLVDGQGYSNALFMCCIVPVRGHYEAIIGDVLRVCDTVNAAGST